MNVDGISDSTHKSMQTMQKDTEKIKISFLKKSLFFGSTILAISTLTYFIFKKMREPQQNQATPIVESVVDLTRNLFF